MIWKLSKRVTVNVDLNDLDHNHRKISQWINMIMTIYISIGTVHLRSECGGLAELVAIHIYMYVCGQI